MFAHFDKFKVYPDFVGKYYQREIEAGLMQYNQPWLYQPNMDYGIGDDNLMGIPKQEVEMELGNDKKYHQFVLEILNMGQIHHGPVHYSLMGLVSKIQDEIIPNHTNYRTRGILQHDIADRPMHYLPHTDVHKTERDVWSFIYYPHDCTGDTYLFKETIDDISMGDRRNHDWYPIDQITPKAGTLIQFPSRQFHAGSPPFKGRRCLINFNFSWGGNDLVNKIDGQN